MPHRRALPPSLLAAALAVVQSTLLYAAEPPSQPWLAMDYGPFLTASIDVPWSSTNIAYKGIAIRLADDTGQPANASILFDTDLLRFAAGWSGAGLELRGLVYDGEHWTYPRVRRPVAFANPSHPGWARDGRFEDPRPLPYGPIPPSWGHWRGLYVHGSWVVLSYSIGETPVLELPGVVPVADQLAFTRSLHLGASPMGQIIQIAADPAALSQSLLRQTLEPSSPSEAADQLIATLESTGVDSLLAAGVIGAPTGARWLLDPPGTLRLSLPPFADPQRIKLVLWRGSRLNLTQFSDTLDGLPPTPDLSPLARGGPSRWTSRPLTRGRLGTSDGPYAIDTLTAPDDNPWHAWLRFGGLDFFPGGRRAAVVTWSGDVWTVDGIEGDLARLTWQRIATGLFQPLGVRILRNQVHVLGRDQITRLHDLNGDGETDFYESFNNDALVSEHFHEFATDLKTDAAGNFYYLKCARHALPHSHPQHGTLLKVTPDGAITEVIARGFRAVNGLGVGPHGELTCVDNQGHWMPANRINWIEPGGFYGNQWAWQDPPIRRDYDPPLCWVHNFVDRSGGTHLWVPDDRWGPLAGQLVTLSYGMGHMFRILHETVGSTRQGGLTRFPIEFDTGVMRGVFHPGNGQLYACGLYGWAGNKTRPGGFYRVRYTGRPLHLPDSLHVAADGVVIGFTDPLDPESALEAGNYDVQSWNYRWSEQYGSPDFRRDGTPGRDRFEVRATALSADRRTVFLQLPDLEPVMQMHIAFQLRAADGSRIDNFVHHTIHRLGDVPGLRMLGPNPTVKSHAPEPERPLRPGLALRFSRSREDAPLDARDARLPALFLQQGVPASPRLPPGPFHARWDGYLRPDLNQDVQFRAEGRGTIALWINRHRAFEGSLPLEFDEPPPPIHLRQGLNRFELAYSPPPDGDARIQLLWSKGDQPPEPIPPTLFWREVDDPELQHGTELRRGLQLATELRCTTCHTPPASWSTNAMPELAHPGPPLDDLADHLQPDWLVRYLLDPRDASPSSRAPRFKFTESDARDITAFLLHGATNSSPSVSSLSAGQTLYDQLGCVACHRLPDDHPLPNDTRLTLDHVAAKYRPKALADYLRDPSRRNPATRMPNFHLTPEESDKLEAFLRSRIGLAATSSPSSPGDAARGRTLVSRLGCLSCHSLTGATNTFTASPVAALGAVGIDQGCLGPDPERRASAPDFALNGMDRSALSAWLRHDPAALLNRDNPLEFVHRSISGLRCNACHARELEPDLWSTLEPLPRPSAQPQPDYDSFIDAGSDGPGSVHLGRPSLTWSGDKLQPDWLARFLTGSLTYKPRPVEPARMPGFPTHGQRLAVGLAHEHGLSHIPDPRPHPDPVRIEKGRRLTLAGAGFGCVSCHPVGSQPALAGPDTATINFEHVTDRLRPDYYWRYLRDPQSFRPGTMMPNFINPDGSTPLTSIDDGDAKRQFDAIWHYLLSLMNRTEL